MAKAPHLFEDLHLDDKKGQVDRINSGLDIAGQGTFKFNITDDNGKAHTIRIPKKLAKFKPPKCAGCLFGAMTRIPWRSRETKASHKVFIVTKPGECISVNQMTSTEVGFYAQMKGKLTKKAVQVCNCLCGLLQPPTLCPPPGQQLIS
jgi:hypothetical protein